jgi:methionyl-tRNA formyltransferase
MENSKMTDNNKTKIIFLGTPEFGAIILEEMINSDYCPSLVFTMPDEPVGRKQILTPPPVKIIAQKYGIPFLQTKKVQEFKGEIEKLDPDLIVSAAFGQIFPQDILDMPKFKSLNVHPSSLPKYRGSSPIQAAILNGDKETGVSIILMDQLLDHGPIVAMSRPIEIDKYDFKYLTKKLALVGADTLIQAIPLWLEGKIEPEKQDDSKAIFADKIEKQNGRIDWKKPSEEIERQIRAFCLWPTSFTFWKKSGKLIQVKILKAKVSDSSDNDYPPGQTIMISQKEIGIKCGKGILIVERLQAEGGKELSSEEFLRGHKEFINQILN